MSVTREQKTIKKPQTPYLNNTVAYGEGVGGTVIKTTSEPKK